MEFGGYRVRFFEGGHFKLDGGGLFGVVPRTVWQQRVQPDDENRVRIACTCLLLEGRGRRVLIETGCGSKLPARDAELYGLESPGGIVAALRAGGVECESIDAILCSHLHFDHAGGLTSLNGSGKAAPSFPRARLFVQRREWDDATANLSHMRTTYRAEDTQPLADAALVETVDGPAEVLPGIRVEPAPGHTMGSQMVLVGQADRTLCFTGDVFPTGYHLRPYWTTAYDIQPATVNQTRAGLVERAVQAGWVLVFPHDPQQPAVRVRVDEKGRWVGEPAGV